VWQWQALEERGWKDQFNSIHETLVAQWPVVANDGSGKVPSRIYFTTNEEASLEDWGNINYLIQTAAEAGFDTSSINIEELGWDNIGKRFVDVAEREIELLFKLYPWEWLMGDEFGWNISKGSMRVVEPAWKMLLSNKTLLPLLWKRHPNHPLLLESYLDNDPQSIIDKGDGSWLRKPTLGREGLNISTVVIEEGKGREILIGERDPKYDNRGYILQKKLDVQHFESPEGVVFPTLGIWIVGDTACGLGIREDKVEVATNMSNFVPHYFE
jgi:glutathionylspermidine synthase